MTTQRSLDSIFIIKQDNADKSLTIIEANDNAIELVHGNAEQLLNSPLYSIFAETTREYLEDAIEFDNEGMDIFAACQKIRELRLKTLQGEEFTTEFHIAPIESRDGKDWFRLVIVHENLQRKREQFSQFLQDHLAGIATLDPHTGLPAGNAASEYIEMFKRMLDSNEMQGICAVIRVDRQLKTIARYGKSGLVDLLKHVANCCKSTFRVDDIVCQIDDHTLALFLVDIDIDAARVVLNRLRWNIRNHRIVFGEKEDFSVTVSIAFSAISVNPAIALQAPIEALSKLSEDERNQLIELVA